MQRFLPFALVLLAAGCASSGPRPDIPRSAEERSIVRVDAADAALSGLGMQITREAQITSASIPASTEDVWKALPQVFTDLEIPLSGVQTSNRLLTATGERLRRIADRSISSYFDCPGSYGNAASNSDVYFVVRSQVMPGESTATSLVRTQIEATARATTSGNSVPCTSRGALERTIMELLMAKLAAPA